jgi:RNA polymerase sigma-70 factor (ECF subfamily)
LNIEELIHECTKNNIKAQEQLYRTFAPKLFSVCLKYSRNYAEAQDNLQESFLIIFEKIHQFNFKGSFDGWIKRVTINYILLQYRKQTALNIVEDTISDEVEVDLEGFEISAEFLIKIIQELPERYKLVFNLYVVDGYSHQEIADLLQINIGTSKSNLSRAKLILKDKIEQFTGNSKMPNVK